MEQEFLKEKAEWLGKMKRGDMAKAARKAGVEWETYYEWSKAKGCMGAEVDNRNLLAAKEAVRENLRLREEAIAA